jgi:hypothetical protein
MSTIINPHWNPTSFRWLIGGTSPAGGASHMELSSTLLDVKTKRISNVSDPVAGQDAATRSWVLGQYLVPNDSAAPAIVTGVSVTAGFEALLVEWNAATEVDMINGYGQYEIQVDNNSDFSSPLVSRKVGANFAAVTGMAPGILLYVRVRAVDAWGTVGTWSTTGSGTPLYLADQDVVDGTINAAKLVAGSILSSHIAAGTIVAEDIATGTLTSNEIAAGTITGGDIGAGTITATNIQANTLTASEIATGAITSDEILANTITAGDIAANTITAAEIAANAITADELNANAVTADKILAGAVTATKLETNLLLAGNIQSSSPGWVTGVSGFRIDGATGSAEFNGNLLIGGDSVLKGQLSVGSNTTLAGMSHTNGSIHSANHTDYRRFYTGAVGNGTTTSGVSYDTGTNYTTSTELDIKVKIKCPDHSLGTVQTLASCNNAGFNARSWSLQLSATGTLEFLYSANGTSSTTITMSGLTLVDNTEYHIRCLFDPDNGTSETAVSFYYSLDPVDDVQLVTDWIQIGTTIETSPNISLFSTSLQTMFGVQFSGFTLTSYYTGKIYSGSVKTSGTLWVHWKADKFGIFAVAGGTAYQSVVEETGKTLRVYTGVGSTSEEARVGPTGFRLRQDGSAFFGSDMIIRGDVTIGDGYGGLIESQNYVADTSGWRLGQDGYAEFSDIKARGELAVSRIEATIGNDILTNGGLDTDTTGWSATDGTIARDNTVFPTSPAGTPASLKITLSAAFTAKVYYTQTNPNPTGEDGIYDCSCWVKFETAGSSYSITVGNASLDAPDTTNWHELKFQMYVPVGADLVIPIYAVGLASTDDMWIDEVVAKPRGRLVGELTGDFHGPAPDGRSLSLPRGIVWRKALYSAKTIDTPGGTTLYSDTSALKLSMTRRYRFSAEFGAMNIEEATSSFYLRLRFNAVTVAGYEADSFHTNQLVPGCFSNTFVPNTESLATVAFTGGRNSGSGNAIVQLGDAGKIELIIEDIGPA